MKCKVDDRHPKFGGGKRLKAMSRCPAADVPQVREFVGQSLRRMAAAAGSFKHCQLA